MVIYPAINPNQTLMIKYNEILKAFQNDLETIQASGSEIIKQSNLAIILCNNSLNAFRRMLEGSTFKSAEDEVHFFKHIKSEPLTQLIYFKEIRTFELSIPKATTEVKKRYITKQLKRIDKFFKKHFEFLQYVGQGFTHLDTLYFLRNKDELCQLIHNGAYYYDKVFNTSHDQLYARIKAYRSFMEYLRNRYNTANNLDGQLNGQTIQVKSIQWTAPKAALIELIYALYAGKTFNNGQTDIKQIADVFQSMFDCELGDYYKTFSEIKIRQKSKTKFLDELTYDLQEFISKSYN